MFMALTAVFNTGPIGAERGLGAHLQRAKNK